MSNLYILGGALVAIGFLFWFSMHQTEKLGEIKATLAYEKGVRETTERLGSEIVKLTEKMEIEQQETQIQLEKANAEIDRLRLTANQSAIENPYDFAIGFEQRLGGIMRCFSAGHDPDKRETCRLRSSGADPSAEDRPE